MAVLVALAVTMEVTVVPAGHVAIGWLVTAVGCALVAWRLRSGVPFTLLICAAFVVLVRYVAFALIYAVLESGIVWKMIR